MHLSGCRPGLFRMLMPAKLIHRIERFLQASPQAVVWHLCHKYKYKELVSVYAYSLHQNNIGKEHLLIDPVYFKKMLAEQPNGYVTTELAEHLQKEFAPQFKEAVFNRLD